MRIDALKTAHDEGQKFIDYLASKGAELGDQILSEPWAEANFREYLLTCDLKPGSAVSSVGRKAVEEYIGGVFTGPMRWVTATLEEMKHPYAMALLMRIKANEFAKQSLDMTKGALK